MKQDHLAVLHAFRDDYATYIPQFHAQNRKRMKLLLADLDAAIAALSALPAAGGAVPSARQWLTENEQVATSEWKAGWDACRVEYPRIVATNDCQKCGESTEAGDGHMGAYCPLVDPEPGELLIPPTTPQPSAAEEGAVTCRVLTFDGERIAVPSRIYRRVHDALLGASLESAVGAQGDGEKKGFRVFPLNIMGDPMREFAPGKWESAVWPSAAPAAGKGVDEWLDIPTFLRRGDTSISQEVHDALMLVNGAANDARHRGEYEKANKLVKARLTLYRAAATEQADGEDVLRCSDCSKPYSNFALDVVLPEEQWMAIYGRPGGVLCASCIVERGSRLPGVTVAKLHFPDLSAAPAAGKGVDANCWSADYGDTWLDCPDDAAFVHGLKVGDEYELQASVYSWAERFRVTKVPDDANDDYEIERVSPPALTRQPVAGDGWRPISTMPTDDTMILAGCADGRMMVYRASILARNVTGPTPEHLRFPADGWMPLPPAPEVAQ